MGKIMAVILIAVPLYAGPLDLIFNIWRWDDGEIIEYVNKCEITINGVKFSGGIISNGKRLITKTELLKIKSKDLKNRKDNAIIQFLNNNNIMVK